MIGDKIRIVQLTNTHLKLIIRMRAQQINNNKIENDRKILNVILDQALCIKHKKDASKSLACNTNIQTADVLFYTMIDLEA